MQCRQGTPLNESHRISPPPRYQRGFIGLGPAFRQSPHAERRGSLPKPGNGVQRIAFAESHQHKYQARIRLSFTWVSLVFDWFHQAELECPLVETSLRRKCGSRVSTSAILVRLGNFSKLEPSGLVENPTSSLQVRAFPLKLQWPKL
jgi:hypothetical protein